MMFYFQVKQGGWSKVVHNAHVVMPGYLMMKSMCSSLQLRMEDGLAAVVSCTLLEVKVPFKGSSLDVDKVT
jgi:hypothetical protein